MRTGTTTRRRTRRALAVATLLPVLALAACNGDDSGDDGKASKDPSASASPGDDQGENGGENDGGNGGATEGGTGGETGGNGGDGATGGNGGDGQNSGIPPLNQAQLDQAALTTGDLPGWQYQNGQGIDDEDTMDSQQAECQPIVDVLGSQPVRARTAHVQVTGLQGEDENGTMVPMLLSAYAAGDAEKVLAELREAVPQCGNFQATEGDDKAEQYHATASKEQMSVGDESFTFDLGSPEELDQSIRITVVRTGGNTTTLLGSDMKTGKPKLVDQAVAKKQHDKLVAAAGS